MISMSIDQRAFDQMIKDLEQIPKKMQNRVMTSAVRAGAREYIREAKKRAPSCMKFSVKIKNEPNEKIAEVTASGREDAGDMFARLSKRLRKSAKESVNSSFIACPPANWVEFGTYGNRNLTKHPYSPATLKRHPDYSKFGHSKSHFWEKPNYWIKAQPFMRPALGAGVKVEQAMAKKISERLEKLKG